MQSPKISPINLHAAYLNNASLLLFGESFIFDPPRINESEAKYIDRMYSSICQRMKESAVFWHPKRSPTLHASENERVKQRESLQKVFSDLSTHKRNACTEEILFLYENCIDLLQTFGCRKDEIERKFSASLQSLKRAKTIAQVQVVMHGLVTLTLGCLCNSGLILTKVRQLKKLNWFIIFVAETYRLSPIVLKPFNLSRFVIPGDSPDDPLSTAESQAIMLHIRDNCVKLHSALSQLGPKNIEISCLN